MSLSVAAQTQVREQARRTPQVASTRNRALVRLYERRTAVDQLISALERYQQEQGQIPEQSRLELLSAVGM